MVKMPPTYSALCGNGEILHRISLLAMLVANGVIIVHRHTGHRLPCYVQRFQLVHVGGNRDSNEK